MEFHWWPRVRTELIEPFVLAGIDVPLECRRNALAKRYRLFIDRSGKPRITIPLRGSLLEARRFAEANRQWLMEQLKRFRSRQSSEQHWCEGSTVLFRGKQVTLELTCSEAGNIARFGSEEVLLSDSVSPGNPGLRMAIETHLRELAQRELPVRVRDLAAMHGCVVHRVSVRNQRTRWGSCSRRGSISLNWRLIQVPEAVRDYIVLHELMHLREMNHSPRFWAQVASVCPDYRDSEGWLRKNSGLLRSLD